MARVAAAASPGSPEGPWIERPWALVSLAWVGPAVLAAFSVVAQGWLGEGSSATWRSALWNAADWLIYAALTPVVFALARRHPLRREALARNLTLHAGASILLCAAWAGSGATLRWLMIPGSEGSISARGLASWFLTSLPFGLAVYFAVLGAEHAARYLLEAREKGTQAARLGERLAEARLEALRAQIHPHFLFNSLNAITVLVRDQDTRTAERMLEQLADVLRHVLRTDRPQEVPLAEELDFVSRYLALEEVRFSDRLRPEVHVDPAVRRALVPDFILQPLIENALRHGLARRSNAGWLRIAARREGEDLVLSVEDDGPGPDENPREGVGLANGRERLRMLHGERGRLDLKPRPGGGAVATIRLPYREVPAEAARA